MANEPRQTGQEAIVKIPDAQGEEIAVSNVTWDSDVNTTDVQHNTSLKPAIAITGLRYSGSFEYSGTNEDLRHQLMYDAGDEFHEEGEPKRVTMTVKEEKGSDGAQDLPRTFHFENVIVTGMSRDQPSDDVSSTSWDFAAEDMYVTGGASGQ